MYFSTFELGSCGSLDLNVLVKKKKGGRSESLGLQLQSKNGYESGL